MRVAVSMGADDVDRTLNNHKLLCQSRSYYDDYYLYRSSIVAWTRWYALD